MGANATTEKFVLTPSADIMRAMVSSGEIKDVDIRDDDVWGNNTALMGACMWRRKDCVRFLLEECRKEHNLTPANPNLTASMSLMTPLHFAVIDGGGGGDDPELIRMLLDNGADRSLKMHSGETALDLAVSSGFKNSVDTLRDYFPQHFQKYSDFEAETTTVLPAAYVLESRNDITINNNNNNKNNVIIII